MTGGQARMMAGGGHGLGAPWFEDLLQGLDAIIWEADARTWQFTFVSDAAEKILGYPVERWLAERNFWADQIHPDDRERSIAACRRATERGEDHEFEYRAVAADGRPVWIRDIVHVVPGPDGRADKLRGVMVDVTERREAEHALAESEHRFKRLVQNSPDAIFLHDAASRIIDVNDAACETLGWTREELVGRELLDIDVALDRPAYEELLRRAGAAGRPVTAESVHRGRDGGTFPVEFRLSVLRSGDEGLYLSFVRDVSERRRAEEQIEYLAYHDDLTGLPNRGLFREHLGLALSRARRSRQSVAVLHVDLDRFKLVNDSLGHAAGDELLRQAGARLRESARAMDLVARHGADEFLILIADVDRGPAGPVAIAEAVARRAHDVLERPFVLGESEFFIGGSIGISVFPVDAGDADTLLAHAAAAVGQAREPGHGPWRFYSGEVGDTGRRLSLGTRLRQAVGRGEFVLHYQPVVALGALGGNAGPAGVEALIRWEDPERGLVPPLEFISLAEDTGLIEPIGDWVLEEVCRQARAWRDSGHDLHIGFNVSPRQLWNPRFAEKMVSDVRAAGVDPGRVVVEITESAAMTDPQRTEAILASLCGEGFTFAIDDFGAGHSSLTRLSELPVGRLKIDKSFVARLPEDEKAATLVTAMIQLAESLGMLSHAEGIETEGQLAFLTERGCTLGQGYLFSEPVPAGELVLNGNGRHG